MFAISRISFVTATPVVAVAQGRSRSRSLDIAAAA
jgi:hypothetical protein